MDRADWLVALGVLIAGVGVWLLLSWGGLVWWAGLLLCVVGVAEARRQ